MANTYEAKGPARGNVQFNDPPFVRQLFGNTKWAWLWLIVRLYVGYSWLSAGTEKLGNAGWTQTGVALKGFWQNAVTQGAGTTHPAIAFDWYRSFIQAMLTANAFTWFSKLVVAGEIAVGVFMILGAFTGIFAFIGGFMNWNFMMAGTASINPVLFTLSIFLILAWKIAGWWGLDRWLLPALGTPWSRGEAFGGTVAGPSEVPARTRS